ncbi:hypothetical protein [Bacteroides thetaiotaomicron]|uniref:hypothetical protein n=1 Tax=Bacteroides thetaiotaomicron TaxID=818 RepID=UPI0023305FDB|nr:hypothetical protein [Bacteroides thetaiotaomicron]MDC2163719.1 hypothetical protein [Bacteroides thetaiotaomicron]
MKHLKKLSCSFLIASALLVACQDDGSFDSFPKEDDQLIPQAREFYEKAISEAAENGTLVQDRNMSPGEVTPRWHEAYLKQDTQYEYVYVPIHAEKNYIRQVEMKKNGHKKTYNVYISQTLCVRKDKEGRYSAAYITMMPSLGHYRRNKNQFTEKVIKSKTLYGDFSGYVAYNNIVTSGLMVIDKVDKGKCQWALSRETPLEKDSIWTLFKEAYKNIRSINLSLTRHTIDGGSLEEVEITPDSGTYYCIFCKADMPYGHVCSDNNNNSNESGPWDGDDNNGLGVGGNGGSEGGEGGGGGSWGGGGSSSGTLPSPNKKPNACTKVELKLKSESFNKLVQDIQKYLNNYPNRECAIYYKYDNVSGEYKTIRAYASLDNIPDINVDPNNVKSADGFIHSHFDIGQTSMAVFSPHDLMLAGFLNENSAIDDLSNYSIGLYTKDGIFFLEITDVQLYKDFYNKYSGEQGESLLNTNYNLYGINNRTEVNKAIEKLSSFLHTNKTGLTLIYKLHGNGDIYYTDKGGIKN